MAEKKADAKARSSSTASGKKQTFEQAVDQMIEEEQFDAALKGDNAARDEILRDVLERRRMRQLPLPDQAMPPVRMPPLKPQNFRRGGFVKPAQRAKGYAGTRIRQAKG